MKIIYGIKDIRKFRNAAVALGVFDGVHRAHRQILSACARKARAINGTSVVVTFWPHPQKKPTLYSLEHRLKLIAQLGIDVCVVVRFNKSFAALTAVDFIHKVLIEKINARYIFVGRNFRFGKFAAGNCKTLKIYAQQCNYRLKVFDVIRSWGKAVSSTSIRKLITCGKLHLAQALLSRPVNILGTVIKGTSLATKLGFPTANINPHHEVLPPHGIYAVKVILGNKKYNGACYIGHKPTFVQQREKNIEVHIFDFRGDIYGKELEVQFMQKIRNEKSFKSIASLAVQIQKDILAAKKILAIH